jgi:hypothetical protein
MTNDHRTQMISCLCFFHKDANFYQFFEIMSEQNKPISEEPISPQSAWLKEVTNKSWNLELLISGASLWLTTYLPDAVEYLLEYQYQYFDILGIAKGGVKLPLLAYAFFKAVAYVLIISFTIHLILRAFWVSLIGLQAAFPDGIRYEHIPNLSKRMQVQYQKRLGSLSDYIIRLDKTCSSVLGLSFTIAFTGVGIGLLYLIIYSLTQLIQSANEDFGQSVYAGVAILAVLVLLLSYWVRKNPDADAKYGDRVAKFSFWLSAASIPFLSKAMSYLSLTMASNSNRKKYYTWMSIIMGLMMTSIFFILTTKIEERGGTSLMLNYYITGDKTTTVHDINYDSHRQPSQAIPAVSIQSDVVEEPFVKVFVAYPPRLNARIEQFCPLPNLPDSLQDKKNPMRNIVRSANRIHCLGNFFRLTVNDSIYTQPKWLFSEKTGLLTVKGIITYLPTQSLPPGQNQLKVEIPSLNNPDSLEIYGALPFWVQ